MFRCSHCNSDNVEATIINEGGFLHCNNCGYKTRLNDQDGGGPKTTPGIEFVAPPGADAQDIQLYRTLNEISTQGAEDARYDGDATQAYNKAVYGNSGGGKKKKSRKNKGSKNKGRKLKRSNKNKGRKLKGSNKLKGGTRKSKSAQKCKCKCKCAKCGLRKCRGTKRCPCSCKKCLSH